MKKNKIEIPRTWNPEIAKEFKTSLQTVRLALLYVTNSPLANKIRERALQRLKDESTKPAEIQ